MNGTPLTVLEYPDPRLQRRAAPAPQVDDSLRRLADDMLATIYATRSIGLAATQVGALVRLIVLDVSEEQDRPLVLVNPEILSREQACMSEERCLSVPGFVAPVRRYNRVRVRGLDRDGQAVELEAEGVLAVCIQHEIDHLDGKLFIDHLSWLTRVRVRRRLARRVTAEAAAS